MGGISSGNMTLYSPSFVPTRRACTCRLPAGARSKESAHALRAVYQRRLAAATPASSGACASYSSDFTAF